ncbi:hypothetical protein S83_017316 [Arachis hypogaea]
MLRGMMKQADTDYEAALVAKEKAKESYVRVFSKKIKLEKELEKIKQNYEDLEYASMKGLNDTIDDVKAQFQVLVLEVNISIIDLDKIMVDDQIVLILEEPKLDDP